MTDWQELYKQVMETRQERIIPLKRWLSGDEMFGPWQTIDADELATAMEELQMDYDEVATFILEALYRVYNTRKAEIMDDIESEEALGEALRKYFYRKKPR